MAFSSNSENRNFAIDWQEVSKKAFASAVNNAKHKNFLGQYIEIPFGAADERSIHDAIDKLFPYNLGKKDLRRKVGVWLFYKKLAAIFPQKAEIVQRSLDEEDIERKKPKPMAHPPSNTFESCQDALKSVFISSPSETKEESTPRIKSVEERLIDYVFRNQDQMTKEIETYATIMADPVLLYKHLFEEPSNLFWNGTKEETEKLLGHTHFVVKIAWLWGGEYYTDLFKNSLGSFVLQRENDFDALVAVVGPYVFQFSRFGVMDIRKEDVFIPSMIKLGETHYTLEKETPLRKFIKLVTDWNIHYTFGKPITFAENLDYASDVNFVRRVIYEFGFDNSLVLFGPIHDLLTTKLGDGTSIAAKIKDYMNPGNDITFENMEATDEYLKKSVEYIHENRSFVGVGRETNKCMTQIQRALHKRNLYLDSLSPSPNPERLHRFFMIY